MNFQLGARLKSMLLVDVDDQSESSTSAASEIKNDAAPKKILEVIEEIDEKETKFNNNARISPTENVMVDPCLVTNEASSTLSTQCMQRIGVESMTNNTSDAPSFSLAEQMMTAAVSAQTSQKERQRNEQQNRAKKATFGIKKGFLLKKDKKKKSSSSNTKNVQVVDNVVCDVIEEVRKNISQRCFFVYGSGGQDNVSLIVRRRITYISLTRTISFRILAPKEKDIRLLLQTHSIFLKFMMHYHHIFNLPSPNGHLRPSSTLLPSIQNYQKDGTIQNTLLRYIV